MKPALFKAIDYTCTIFVGLETAVFFIHSFISEIFSLTVRFFLLCTKAGLSFAHLFAVNECVYGQAMTERKFRRGKVHACPRDAAP